MENNEKINKKKSIINKSLHFSYKTKMKLLNIIKQHIDEKLIKESQDGCRINLDNLDNNIIETIYFIVNKLEETNKNIINNIL